MFIVYTNKYFVPKINICPLLIAAKLYTLVRQLEEKKKQGSHQESNPEPPALAAGALNPDTQICPVVSQVSAVEGCPSSGVPLHVCRQRGWPHSQNIPRNPTLISNPHYTHTFSTTQSWDS